MNSKKLYSFLFALLTIILLTEFITYYFLNRLLDRNAKEKFSKETELKSEIIARSLQEDLLMNNLIEAERKLVLFTESNQVTQYRINPKEKLNPNFTSTNRCSTPSFLIKKEIRYSDRGEQWGDIELCFSGLTLADLEEQRKTILYVTAVIFLVLTLVLMSIIFYFIRKNLQQLSRSLNENSNENKEEEWLFSPIATKMQEASRKITQLEKQSALFSLASTIAHDLRSPIAVLEECLKEDVPSKDKLDLIKRSAERLKNIANNLLHERKNSSDARPELIPLHELLTEMINEKRIEFPNTKIINELSHAHIEGDKLGLTRAISNFLNNALEATPLEKETAVRLRYHANDVILEIQDQGAGIPDSLLKKLGEEQVVSTKSNGNGLGVYSSVQTIRKMNGDVKFTSSSESGTTVSITLPRQKMAISQIVLIDDDELIQLSWISAAKKKDIAITVFSSSAETLASLPSLSTETNFYIDVNLGEENGVVLAETLMQKGYQNLYLCTGHDPKEFAHLAFIKGVRGKSTPF